MCDLRCGALAHARFAALWRRSRSRSARRFCGGAAAHARFAALWRRSRSRSVRRFAAVSGGGKDSLCDLRRGALARARFAALRRRFPAAAKTFCATFGAALPLTPGSPPSVFGGALACARLAALCFRRRSRATRFAASGGAPAPLGSPLPAAAKTLCATFGRRSRSRSARRPLFPAALPRRSVRRFRRRSRAARFAASGGGKDFLCDLRAALSLRSARRFAAALSLTPGSPLPAAVSGGGKDFLCDLSAALSLRSVRRFVAVFGGGKDSLCDLPAVLPLAPGSPLRRRSRSRPVRRFGGGSPSPLGSPLCGGALAPLGSPLRRCSRSRPARRFGAALSLRSVRRFGAFLRRPRPKVVKKIKKIADRYFIFS